ncbi:MAG: hypothetical protein SNJ84_05735 [Verrucomicrobiia bacterium]
MIRQICWNEKNDDGTKTEIRVDFFARSIKWQFKPTGADRWDYQRSPTRAQWEELLNQVSRRYQRGRARIDDLHLVQTKLAQIPTDPPPA